MAKYVGNVQVLKDNIQVENYNKIIISLRGVLDTLAKLNSIKYTYISMSTEGKFLQVNYEFNGDKQKILYTLDLITKLLNKLDDVEKVFNDLRNS